MKMTREINNCLLISIFSLFSLILILTSCKRDLSSLNEGDIISFPPAGNDTTSHEFTWQMDTISYPTVFQIGPNAIWGSDTNDVWMAGHSDWWKARVWHWDGKKWTPYERAGLGVSIQDMIGFSSGDIWLCGRRIGDAPPIETIKHWDGTQWNIVNHNYEQHILSVWGTSAHNLFFGFIDGKIAHYDGVSFTTYDTGTKAQILDIYGLNDEHVFATGIAKDEQQPFDTTYYYIFRYDGSEFIVNNFFMRTKETSDPDFPWRNLWRYNKYIFGSGYGIYYSTDYKTWELLYRPRPTYAMYGSNINNIFIGGVTGETILHYNGKTWADFPELHGLDFWSMAILCFKDHVFIGGIMNDHNAYILRGRRVIKGGD